MSRVLFVSKPIAPPFDDGTKNLVRDLAEALDGEAEVLVPEGAEGPGRRAVFGPREAGHALSSAGALRLVTHLLTAPLPPVLHWVFTPSGRSAALPALIARARRRPAVWTIPSRPAPGWRFGSLDGVARLFVFSAGTRAALVEAGAPAERVEVIAPWLRAVEVPSAERVARARSLFGLPGRVTLFAGDLGEGRGGGELLEAFAEVRTPDDRLIIAARPKGQGARAARRRFVERVRALGVGAQVRVEGAVSDMAALLAVSDVVALPAQRLDAKVDVPLVLLEALSLGRPVLVAEGSSAAVLAERGAAVAAPATPEGIGAALVRLWSSPEERRELAERGRALVQSEHAPRRLAQHHRALYQSLAPASHGEPGALR
jgi:phosphatidylinositol alpha-1,6-mannosyltransferase